MSEFQTEPEVDSVTVFRIVRESNKPEVFTLSMGAQAVELFEFDSAKSHLVSVDIPTKVSPDGRKTLAVRREYRVIKSLTITKDDVVHQIDFPLTGEFMVFGKKAKTIAVKGGQRVSSFKCKDVLPTVTLGAGEIYRQMSVFDVDDITLEYESTSSVTLPSNEADNSPS